MISDYTISYELLQVEASSTTGRPSLPKIGSNGWLALGWGIAITVLGYLWSKSFFNRDPSR
ncbi:hypothetical protein ACWD6R_24750 [Streptomyces sp. NPDC005151]